MPLYHGSTAIGAVYHGSTSIGRVYRGSTLVFDASAGGGGGGVSYVGGKTFTWDGNGGAVVSLTDLTGGSNSSPAVGDVVVVALLARSDSFSGGNIDLAISGYTEAADLYADDTQNANLGVFFKVLSAPDSSLTLPGMPSSTAAVNYPCAAIQVWRGVDGTTPLDVAIATATGTNTHVANPPAITPITQGAVILAIGAGALPNSAAPFTSAELEHFLAVNQTATTLALGSTVWSGSGAFNPAAFSGGGALNGGNAWAAATLALRPAS